MAAGEMSLQIVLIERHKQCALYVTSQDWTDDERLVQ